MLARILIPVGLFVVWSAVCHHWYVCHIKQVCDEQETTEQTEPQESPTVAAVADYGPIVFNWSNPEAVTNEKFAAFRDSIIGNLPQGHTLEIEGHYFKEETAPADFSNMGMARAAKIKALFDGLIPEDRFLLSSRLVKSPDDAKSTPFAASLIKSFEPKAEEEAEIVELEDEVIIQFPFNSVQKKADPKVDEYLDKLAKTMIGSKQQVTITGHTDDIGGEANNIKLGRARARYIRDLLVNKGVAKNRIRIESKGETEPVADNGSEVGRRKNRRAVLQIID